VGVGTRQPPLICLCSGVSHDCFVHTLASRYFSVAVGVVLVVAVGVAIVVMVVVAVGVGARVCAGAVLMTV
jgi:hypothetical protein